jgi:SAM-dependent methyltransferase
MPNILRNENRTGVFYRRNAAAIGYACRDINLHSFDPVFWAAMEGLDFTFGAVADLGCGTGGRLAQIAARYPGTRGVGIDIAPAALRDAQAYLDAAGFGERFSFVQGDARALRPDPRFAEVEVLTCFMMGHDFWPRDECVASLRRIREAFPNVKRFLLGDTARTVGIPDRDKPVFTLAFETAHDLMGVYLPTLEEWAGVFADSGWTCHAVHPVTVPADSVLYELA